MTLDLAAARQALAASSDPEDRALVEHLDEAEGLEGRVVALLEDADPSLGKQLESRLERVQAIVRKDRSRVLAAAEALNTRAALLVLEPSGNPHDRRLVLLLGRAALTYEEALGLAQANPKSSNVIAIVEEAGENFERCAEQVRRRAAARGVYDRRGPGTYLRAYARMVLSARAPLVRVPSGARARESRPAQRRGTRVATGSGDRAGPGSDDPDLEPPLAAAATRGAAT